MARLLTFGGASCGCGLEEKRRQGAGRTLDLHPGSTVIYLAFHGTKNSILMSLGETLATLLQHMRSPSPPPGASHRVWEVHFSLPLGQMHPWPHANRARRKHP